MCVALVVVINSYAHCSEDYMYLPGNLQKMHVFFLIIIISYHFF